MSDSPFDRHTSGTLNRAQAGDFKPSIRNGMLTQVQPYSARFCGHLSRHFGLKRELVHAGRDTPQAAFAGDNERSFCQLDRPDPGWWSSPNAGPQRRGDLRARFGKEVALSRRGQAVPPLDYERVRSDRKETVSLFHCWRDSAYFINSPLFSNGCFP